MDNSALPAAGWYAAPHAGGEQRYWDGSAWTEPVAADSPPTSSKGRGRSNRSNPRPPRAPRKGARAIAEPAAAPAKRTVSLKTGAIVAGSTLVLGLIIGGSTGGAGAQSEIASLTDQVSTAQTSLADATAAAGESEKQVTLATQTRDTAAKERDAAKARVAELEAAAATAQTELDARAATIADLQGKVSAQSAPSPTTDVSTSQTSEKVYYKNCTAARAAGAAPVRRGDPGYGSHLDRDGDGIGCEK